VKSLSAAPLSEILMRCAIAQNPYPLCHRMKSLPAAPSREILSAKSTEPGY
jgi:hypothetical protein